MRKLKMLLTVFIMMWLFLPAAVHALDNNIKPTPALINLKSKIVLLQELAKEGIITQRQAEDGTSKYLADAKKLVPGIEMLQLLTLKGESTEVKTQQNIGQKIMGWFTWLKMVWIFVICMGVWGLTVLVPSWIKIFVMIPKEVYEAICYLASGGFIYFGYTKGETGPFLALIGCLLFAASLTLTAYLHQMKKSPARYFGTLFIVWSAITILLNSSMIGFISIVALMASLGFSAAVIPCGYAVGFNDKDGVWRGTVAAFTISIVYTIAYITTGNNLPQYFKVFEAGALLFAPFVAFLGLLISSSRWYAHHDNNNYVLLQFLMVIACLGTAFVGLIWNVPAITKFGSTFFCLYIIEKPFEIKQSNLEGYATVAIIMSIICSGAIYYALEHPWTHKFLLFL